jgi:hypothetical protein
MYVLASTKHAPRCGFLRRHVRDVAHLSQTPISAPSLFTISANLGCKVKAGKLLTAQRKCGKDLATTNPADSVFYLGGPEELAAPTLPQTVV